VLSEGTCPRDATKRDIISDDVGKTDREGSFKLRGGISGDAANYFRVRIRKSILPNDKGTCA